MPPETKKAAFYAGCFRIIGLYGFGFDDDDRFGRNIIMVAVALGGYAFDGVDSVKTVDYLAEYGITPVLDDGSAVHFFGAVVEEGIVGSVDEELRTGGMGVGSACHGDGVFIVG